MLSLAKAHFDHAALIGGKSLDQHVLSLGPAADATDDVGVDTVKMPVVQVEKTRGFGLRRFHQAAFAQLVGDRQRYLSSR